MHFRTSRSEYLLPGSINWKVVEGFSRVLSDQGGHPDHSCIAHMGECVEPHIFSFLVSYT